MNQLPPQPTPPTFELDSTAPDPATAEIIALPVAAEAGGLVLGPGADELDARYGLLDQLEFAGATGKAGEVTACPVAGTDHTGALRQVLLVGIGAGRRTDFRRAGAALARATRDRTAVVTTIPAADPGIALEPFVAGATLGSFVFHWRSEGPEWQPVGALVLAELGAEHGDRLDRAVAIAHASWRARFLATVPAGLESPAWLAEQAVALDAQTRLKVRVWDEDQLAEGGFGGILTVGQGSATPPRLIRLDYTPARSSRRTPTVALIGKGITFDTGGLNLKPGQGMATMKRDMTGGGVVLATMAALAAVDCPVKVVGLIAAAENAVSGSAMRPGDVITHYGGRTSEVNNTDAEGRLVLADAMAYAVAKVKPAALVDIATLTGAMKVALGQQLGGFFATDDRLAARIGEAGETAGEPVWRMPLAEVYEPKVSSQVADGDNAAGGPGAITAALFLQHFTGGLPWVHLDIASVGDAPTDTFEWTPGPTGYGARLLLTWLGSADPLG
ncbi:MAG: leucyl aminopeptidase family protein [Nocardioides sp.]|uniref:leucyl aminopeptidase family protein n=1 Tax=Nocardioides sp. TaxID=35761 RepID=UPI0039E31539